MYVVRGAGDAGCSLRSRTVLKQPKRQRGSSQGFTSQAASLAVSTWLCASHPAEDSPAAVRQLLPHREPSATDLLRLDTRRLDIRSREGASLDCPATLQKSEVFRFRNVAQHLEPAVGRLAFVARSDSLLADVRWLA
jgi:hypothetical protein